MNTISEAIKEFLHHCKFEKRLSEKTIKSYLTDLNQFSEFLTKRNYPTELNQTTKKELSEYLEHISIFKPKTIKRKIATLKVFFGYLEFEEKIGENPFRKIRMNIKEPLILPKALNIYEINKIFKSCYSKLDSKNLNNYLYRSNLRNAAVIELLFATGARVSEIANLKDKDIALKSGAVLIKGKGNKERLIQICNKETLDTLMRYRKLFDHEIGMNDNYFLVNRLKHKLSDQSIRGIVKNVSNNAGIQKRVTPHVFRHTFATLLLEKDVDISYIKSLLGHSSIMTTQIYAHVNAEKQKRILETKHPREDISFEIKKG